MEQSRYAEHATAVICQANNVPTNKGLREYKLPKNISNCRIKNYYSQSTENEISLRARILELESICRDHGIDPALSTRSAVLHSPTNDHSTRIEGGNRTERSGELSLESAGSHPNLVPTPVSMGVDSHEVTAMGTIESDDGFVSPSNASQNFYGRSSAAYFLQEACITIGILPNKRSSVRPIAVGNPTPLDKHSLSQLSNFQLPTRTLADHLIQCYLKRVYYLYPYFHLPAFEHSYDNLWLPEEKRVPIPTSFLGLGIGEAECGSADSIVFHAALNAIFALGCPFSDLPDADKVPASEVFFNRAKAHMGTDLIEMNHLGVVQTLLLVAQALQGTSFPNRCWNASGIAHRMALAMGLHLENGDAVEEELKTIIRRRTWYGCITMEV